ncbi:MAG: SMP-30/gluconolactonase/LRE family protein [Gammaproteobacteria bacterium]|uniref:SMP-30/gluconolactonase/LRE family protein n=1 Tax=Rhodoferax sp. TaxID=50421 RepID=UPI0017E6CAA9|nr:SMP-30/gluconolactonase/LRE family protein [Rhodoferax sp.]MBU3897339.1 SMP-30/gluconolactonase/LRE family protein [Gammaproteobacteria bacterium]MBA3058644.1 SMP-30/gluconolactonase/LRE family protein [Rhodoferax sp.]MBU3998307.1 SMP-30/gluconolactonase/LRE family protein [Gammaproteobacteria bacterium]MBU4018685.1 SMP-30/gluconolactonase/LRE family protein [Gammaproteobacteria bacterium]MBU4079640.1 SMP-30/gluconolactonase/LRE family protein [Gammaproteobacteria bacterium]
MSWQTISPEPCLLGESPFWHPREQRLYWVDIAARQILRSQSGTSAVERWDMPSEPGCIAPAASGGLVMALRHGVFRAREWGGALELVATLDYDPQQLRANDGKCDALGRFWIGTLDETRVARNAALFSLDCRAGGAPQIERQLDESVLPATTANGLAWSPNDRTLYWADTASHTIYAWDFDLTANRLSRQRSFASFAPKAPGWQFDPALTNGGYQGRPDGAAVDVQGNYWVAMYEGGRVCQFAPDGALLAEFATPAQCPTMPCFGGEDLQTLYVTTARRGRSEAELAHFPKSGCVLAMRVAVPGLPVNFFVD